MLLLIEDTLFVQFLALIFLPAHYAQSKTPQMTPFRGIPADVYSYSIIYFMYYLPKYCIAISKILLPGYKPMIPITPEKTVGAGRGSFKSLKIAPTTNPQTKVNRTSLIALVHLVLI